MHFCSARQSAFAVHAMLTEAWHAPPWLIAAWRHVPHAMSGCAGVAAHAVVAHCVMHGGAPPSAPVPMQAHASAES